MKIILPHQKASQKVTTYKDIKQDVDRMLEMLNGRGNFAGQYKNGWALSHAQVSEKPYAFFVTHKSFEGILPEIVINPRILEAFEPVQWKEACLSYPFRPEIKTVRHWRLIVEFDVPQRGILGTRLKTEQLSVDGLAAILFQHEVDHSKGIDIYHKFGKK